MKLVYLAHPYGGNVTNVYKSKILANYLNYNKIYPGVNIFNAVAYFFEYAQLKTEVEIMAMCIDMLGRCDELWLAPGWEDSPGCKAEIEHATKLGMRVKYLLNIKGDTV